MDEQLLMKTAALAGELLLENGAETYRVEDTMDHILKTADNLESSDVMVVMTGITATLKVKDEDIITVMKRVKSISTNLNIIVQVNEISRALCSKQISLEDAYDKMLELKPGIYSKRAYEMAYIVICVGFVIFFGGGPVDVFAGFIVGIFFNAFSAVAKDLNIHDVLHQVVVSIGIAFVSMTLKSFLKVSMNADVVMIGCIMPLVPGITFTTSIRDFHNGDYLSGTIHLIDALTTALCIAVGICLPLAIYSYMGGGALLP